MNLTQHTIRRLLITTIAPAVLTGLAQSASAQPFDISWYTMDCGGGTSTAGQFELSGTIGQHDTGVMSGGQYTLTGGYWSGAGEAPCYADCDPNGELDIFDFLCFQNSFVLGEPYACECDPDPVCDIFDFLCFQNAFVGGCP